MVFEKSQYNYKTLLWIILSMSSILEASYCISQFNIIGNYVLPNRTLTFSVSDSEMKVLYYDSAMDLYYRECYENGTVSSPATMPSNFKHA